MGIKTSNFFSYQQIPPYKGYRGFPLWSKEELKLEQIHPLERHSSEWALRVANCPLKYTIVVYLS